MEVEMTITPSPQLASQPARSLFSQITVDHGPAGVLGRLFLKAEKVARDRGLHLSFATMQDLVEVNRKNRVSWVPLFSGFDPALNRFSDHDTLCIFGRNEHGEVVATQAARLYDWPNTNYREEVLSLRLLYSDPDKSRLPGERCEVTAVAARGLTGRIVYSGAAWYRPDYRGRGLVEILPRMARALAYTRWNPDCTVTMMADALVRKGVSQRTGHRNIEWDVRLINTRTGTLRVALLWTKTGEMLEDLEAFLSGFDSALERPLQTAHA
jgi:hypothetical protein